MHFIREVKSDFIVKKPLLLAIFIFIIYQQYKQSQGLPQDICRQGRRRQRWDNGGVVIIPGGSSDWSGGGGGGWSGGGGGFGGGGSSGSW